MVIIIVYHIFKKIREVEDIKKRNLTSRDKMYHIQNKRYMGLYSWQIRNYRRKD